MSSHSERERLKSFIFSVQLFFLAMVCFIAAAIFLSDQNRSYAALAGSAAMAGSYLYFPH